MRRFNANHKALLLASVPLMGLAVLWMIYVLFGHWLIETIYQGESLSIFNRIMVGRATTPLENYKSAADKLMRLMTQWVAIFILSSLILLKLRLLAKIIFLCVFSFLSSLCLFSIFELFPSLISPLNLTVLNYYSIKNWYIPDDSLVFVEKPFQMDISYNHGDKYSPLYGIKTPLMKFEWISGEDGFRGDRIKENAGIIVIGDSYIEYGHDENDMFGSKLENLLNTKVKSFGRGGYGPIQYVEVLKRYGIHKKPKYAILSFFEGNDISDTREYLHWKDGGAYYRMSIIGSSFIKRYFAMLGDLYEYLNRMVKSNHGIFINKYEPTNEEVHPDLSIINLLGREYTVLFFYKNKVVKMDDPTMLKALDAIKIVLNEFKEVCQQNNIEPIMMYIPIAAHIYAEYSTERSGKHWLEIRDEQIRIKGDTEGVIAALASAVGVEMVSLTPAFEQAAREGKLLYYPFDTHWNSEARDLAAAIVAAALRHRAAGGFARPTDAENHAFQRDLAADPVP